MDSGYHNRKEPLERKILKFLTDDQARKGYPPTVREIGQTVGLKSTSSVHHYLTALENKGLIRRDPAKPRAIEVIRSCGGENGVKIPVLGNVAAGEPILAAQSAGEYLNIDLIKGNPEEHYLLRVYGNSMIKIGIFNGDLVLVKKANTADEGQVVVALVDDSATIKRFYRMPGGGFRLQPENDSMEPIYTDHVVVQGIVKKVLHDIK